ncbi:hypothetical protein Tco_0848053, partial [Tanacetum coccineum]
MSITATIDGKVKVVYKASIRRHLKLEDADGISTLSIAKIFKQLALMGNMKRASKGYTGVDTPLFQTMLIQGQTLQGEGSTILVESYHTPTSAPSTSQPPTSSPSMPTTHVKKLEHKVKSIKARRKVKFVISDVEDDLEDPFKQGRKINHIDEDEGICVHRLMGGVMKILCMRLVYIFTGPSISITTAEPVTTAGEGVSTARAIPEEVSTAEPDMDVTLAEALVDLLKSGKKKSPKIKERGISFQDPEEVARREEDQIQSDEELALRLHAEEQAEFERLQKERVAQEEVSRAAIYDEIDNIQAMIEADKQLAARVQAREQELYSIKEKSRLLVEIIVERKRFFAAQRAAEQRSKPPTKTQMRNRM